MPRSLKIELLFKLMSFYDQLKWIVHFFEVKLNKKYGKDMVIRKLDKYFKWVNPDSDQLHLFKVSDLNLFVSFLETTLNAEYTYPVIYKNILRDGRNWHVKQYMPHSNAWRGCRNRTSYEVIKYVNVSIIVRCLPIWP